MEGPSNPFLNRRVAFEGKLGSMTLREASMLVRRLGGTPVGRDDPRLDLLVLGDDVLVEAASNPALQVLSETELWQALGLLEGASGQLYTPAMLGDLLGVPAATIRRWHRTGLIHPRQTVHRLPYFAFEEIAVAKRLVELAENGATAEMIEARLRELARHWPGVNRPLAQLALVVEGRRLLVKRDGETLEPSGQKRLAFEVDRESDEPTTIPLHATGSNALSHTPEQLLALAEELDDAGDNAASADMYRAAIAAGGPSAQINFQLAECLYRLGELAAARERYSMAVEIDDHFVEARANLGCVLAELGQTDLAIAALQGVLALSDNHADAHYHLARLYEAAGNSAQADQHRQLFQQLTPASPWATETLGS